MEAKQFTYVLVPCDESVDMTVGYGDQTRPVGDFMDDVVKVQQHITHPNQ